MAVRDHLEALALWIECLRHVSEAAEAVELRLARDGTGKSHQVVSDQVGLHTLVIVVLDEYEEISEAEITFESPLASVEDHQDEYEFGELLLAPLLSFVKVLKHAVDEQVPVPLSLLVGGKHVVRRGDLGAHVLEDVEAQLEHLVEVLILKASWQWLLVQLISLQVSWMTLPFDYWSLFVIVAVFA
jgi:hypothetical protein